MARKRKQKRSKRCPIHATFERGRQNVINDALNDFIGVIPGFTRELKKKAKLQLITIYLKCAFLHVWKVDGLPILDHFSVYEKRLFSEDDLNIDKDSFFTNKEIRVNGERSALDVAQTGQTSLDNLPVLKEVKQKRKCQDNERGAVALDNLSVLKEVKQKRKCQDNERGAVALCPIKREKGPCIIYLKNADISSNAITIVPGIVGCSKIIPNTIDNINNASARVTSFETNAITFPHGQNDFVNGIYETVQSHECPSVNITAKHGYSSQENISPTVIPISKTPVSFPNFVVSDHTNLFSRNSIFENSEDYQQQSQKCLSEGISGLDLLAHVSSMVDPVFVPEIAATSNIYKNTQGNFMSAPKYQCSETEQSPFSFDYNCSERNAISANGFSESVQNSCFENIGVLSGMENSTLNDSAVLPNGSLAFNATLFPKGNKGDIHTLSNIAVKNISDDSDGNCIASDLDLKVNSSDAAKSINKSSYFVFPDKNIVNNMSCPKNTQKNFMAASNHPCSEFQQDPFPPVYNYNERSTNASSETAQNLCSEDMEIVNSIKNIAINDTLILPSNNVTSETNFQKANKENTSIFSNAKIENTADSSEKDCTASDFVFEVKLSDIIKPNNEINYPSFLTENIVNNSSWLKRGERAITKKKKQTNVKYAEGNETMLNENFTSPFVSKQADVYEKVNNKCCKEKPSGSSFYQQTLVDSQKFANVEKLKPHCTKDANDKLSRKVDTTSCRLTTMNPVQLKAKKCISSPDFIYDKENLIFPLTNPRNSNKSSFVIRKEPLKDYTNITAEPKILEQGVFNSILPWQKSTGIDNVIPKTGTNFQDSKLCAKVETSELQIDDSREFISADPNINMEISEGISNDGLLSNSQSVGPVDELDLQDFQSCGYSPFACILGVNPNCIQLKLDEKKGLGNNSVPILNDMFDLLESQAKK